MARITLILILISISTLARATDWKYLGTKGDRSMYFVDAESVLIEGNTRTFWNYFIFKEPQTIRDTTYYATKTQSNISCEKRTMRILVIQLLDSKGNQIEYADASAYASDMPIEPDSVSDAMRKYVCSIKKSAE